MNREVKNGGEYLEVDADKLAENIEAAKKAKVLVVTKTRIELAGIDKDNFLKRYEHAVGSLYQSNFTPEQLSDCVVRTIVCG